MFLIGWRRQGCPNRRCQSRVDREVNELRDFGKILLCVLRLRARLGQNGVWLGLCRSGQSVVGSTFSLPQSQTLRELHFSGEPAKINPGGSRFIKVNQGKKK